MNWLVAVASGVAVLFVTMVADRIGPRAGGLLATAPVTSIIGVGWMLLHTADPALARLVLLSGGYSLAAAAMATWCYCRVVLRLADRSRRLAVPLGLLFFLVTYGGVMLALRALVPPGWGLLLGSGALAVLLYVVTGRSFPPPQIHGRCRSAGMPDYFWRMLAGILAVRLVQWAALLDVRIAGALSVFPGVFVVSLGVMGLRGSPRFSLQAARAGFLGMLAVLAFLCGYLVWLPWVAPPYRHLAVSSATALLFYFLVVFCLHFFLSRPRFTISRLPSGIRPKG